MRIIFLLYHGFSESSGISKKILCQIKALRELGHRVNVCTYDMNKNRHRVRMMDEEIIEDYGTGKWAAVRKRISYDGIYRYAVAQEVNMIYVRSFHNANPFTVRLFYRLQKAGIKIAMEIPTYPYDSEYKGFPFFTRCGLQIDRLFRKTLAKYNPQIQISAESETKRSIFREKDKTKRSKKESAQHSKSRNKSFVMTSVSAL